MNERGISIYRYQPKSHNLVMQSEHANWNLGCAAYILNELLQTQITINEHIQLYNQDLQNIKSLIDVKHYESVDALIITNQIFAYSYNGAKFDNHFILSAIKNKHGATWFEFVSYIGDSSDMKVMRYNNISFCDLKLMTAGTSLKQFCADMKLDVQDSKIDIDIAKMKTYSVALKNRDEIMKYVLQDSLALKKIHRKFEKSVRCIIQDLFDHRGESTVSKYVFDESNEKSFAL